MTSNNIFMLHKSYFADADPKQESYSLDDLFAALQTYQMEFDGHCPVGRLPRCFSREFGHIIDSYVMLRDPCHNEIEVHVAKRSKELYFDEGWAALRSIYDLWFGAWVTFAYINPKLLTIRLTTRWGTEVRYPVHNPPLKYSLPRVHSSPPIPPNKFVRSISKEITFYDVHSGILILPWYGFGEFVFKFQHSDLVLIDSSGERYPCKLKFGVDPEGHLACKISGGWVGERVFIPRLSLTPSDKRLPFKFQRRQFPLTLSYAMTINKSQGQSLQYVGVYLPHPIFSHGQLYVALSRVTSRQGLKILIANESGDYSNSTHNVVYKEVFRNI